MQLFARFSGRIDRPGSRETRAMRTGFFQCFGTFGHGAAGGKYIVDQQHVLPRDLTRNSKRVFHVFPPLFCAQFRLGLRVFDALDDAGHDGKFAICAKGVCNQFTLVETPLASPLGVQGDGEQNIGR